MRSYFCTKLHRRFVVKYFGSTRNLLLWFLAVSLTVYVLDSYLFSSQLDSHESDLSVVDPPKTQEVQEQPTDSKKEIVELKPANSISSASHVQLATGANAVVPAASSGKCGQQETCPAGEFSYFIQSGFERDVSPTICFNGHYAFSKDLKNGKRGINMLVINDKTMAVEDTREFDTYEDDAVLLRYLRLGIEDHHIILLATQDDAITSLSDMSKKWLQAFGSDQINDVKFRDNFVMIGQRGLAVPGTAIQKISHRIATKEYPEVAEISGCVKIPMGQLKPAEDLISPGGSGNSVGAGGIKFGEKKENCGITDGCPADSFSVHLFTGKENVDGPRLCINGNYVFDNGVNNAGRGINVAVVDTKKLEVISAARYDTYESSDESASLTKLLRSITDNQIVIAVSHDDMQSQLSEDAQKAFESLGSSYIKQVAFRDAWAFVGQDRISGFSPVEEIEFGGPDTWPLPVDKKFCVPKQMKGGEKKPDVNIKKNSPKRVFCRKYDGYEDFCRGPRLDEQLTPAPLLDSSMMNNPIFGVPIIVIPGLSHVATLQQFEALLVNPGIVPKMVMVMYDIKFEESGLLADFFGFGKMQLESSTKYIYLIEKALEEAWKLFPEAKYVILLEEEVIPSQDFLHYMAQCLPVLDRDESLVGATAWNENGFEGVSGLPDTVYRGNTFPGLGFMLKKSFYVNQMRNKMSDCCLRRSWYGWYEGKLNIHEMLIPDVSRVSRRQFMGLTENGDFIKAYFNRPRTVSSGKATQLLNLDELSADKYDGLLNQIIASSVPLSSSKAEECAAGKSSGFDVPSTKGKSYVIYYEQDSGSDETVLSHLCQCFGLFYATGYHSKGVHQGVLRFSYNENHMFLIGSASPFYKHKPAGHQPVTKVHMSANIQKL